MLVLLLACSTPATTAPSASPAPSAQEASVAETVPDPRAYVRAAFLAHPQSWAHTAAYNLDDPALLDEVIDKAVRTRRRAWNGELPADKRELDAFISLSRGMYATAQLDTPERRARVEANVRSRYERPAIRFDGETAFVDLGWAPGPLKPARSGWSIPDSDRLAQREILPEDVRRAFQQGHQAHPGAAAWQVNVEVPRGSRSMRYVYRYETATDRLYVRADGGDTVTPRAKCGGIEGLIAGAVPTHTSEMVGTNEDARFYELEP